MINQWIRIPFYSIAQAFFNIGRRKKLKLKHKTQAKNSRKKLNHREALSSFWEKLQKKLIFTNLSLKTEIFFGVTTFSDIYIIKNDKILPISSI